MIEDEKKLLKLLKSKKKSKNSPKFTGRPEEIIISNIDNKNKKLG